MERRIAAILVGDMVGYSRLIELDEANTLARQRKHMLELIDPTIERMNGRIVKLTGDGMIAEFGSVVEAVQCAVAIQKEMLAREEDQTEDRRIQYRIAINLGDVVFEDDDVFGDGVNIAARLEALAEPGGIVVSGTAFDLLKNHVDVGYLPLGEKKLKNIATPVRVYQVTEELTPLQAPVKGNRRVSLIAASAIALVLLLAIGWWWTQPDVEPASPKEFALELPDKPSVAVMPFVNMTGEEADGYLADGFVDLLITELSLLPDLFVIARNSSFSFRNKDARTKEISETLGVRYIVEGSFRRTGEQLQVSVQLVDALAGNVLWSDRYDRPASGFYNLQQDLIVDLVREIGGRNSGGIFLAERQRVKNISNTDLSAVELWEKATQAFLKYTKDGNEQNRKIAEELILIAPDHPRGYDALGWYHLGRLFIGYSTDNASDINSCIELANKAIALDELDYMGHFLSGYCNAFAGKSTEAAAAIQRAFNLNPSDVLVIKEYAKFILVRDKKYTEAIEMLEGLLRLSPGQQRGTASDIGVIYIMVGDFEKAVEFQQSEVRQGASYKARLAASMWLNGQKDEARTGVSEILQVNPDYTANTVIYGMIWVPEETKRLVADALVAAGLPE
jgi:adenylate cyclase